MKPTEPDIAWCLEHKEDVARWLEQRGGIQQGDWFWTDDLAYTDTVMNIASWEEPEEVWNEVVNPVWLPSVGDVLEMLGDKGLNDVCIYWIYGIWGYRAMLSKGSVQGEGKTRLIALMELLKASNSCVV